MVRIGIDRKKKGKSPTKLQSIAAMKRAIESNLAAGAGTTRIKSRDPIYHITDNFRATFELTGKHKADQMAGKNIQISNEELGQSDEEQQQGETEQAFSQKSSENTLEGKAKGYFYGRFSEIAFKNGRLASAILQNEGQTLFIQCMKRALGQSEHTFSRRSKLFSKSSRIAPLSNTLAQDRLRHYTTGAIGLVVDSILNARRTLQLFERLASDDADKIVPRMKYNNFDNIFPDIYPFLNTSEDEKNLAAYKEKLSELTLSEGSTGDRKKLNEIAGQRAVLAAGITKTQGLITRKRQLQEQFFYRLEQLLENSRKAEAMFTAASFADNVVEELLDSPLPEDDDRDDRDDSDDSNEDQPEEPAGK